MSILRIGSPIYIGEGRGTPSYKNANARRRTDANGNTKAAVIRRRRDRFAGETRRAAIDVVTGRRDGRRQDAHNDHKQRYDVTACARPRNAIYVWYGTRRVCCAARQTIERYDDGERARTDREREKRRVGDDATAREQDRGHAKFRQLTFTRSFGS